MTTPDELADALLDACAPDPRIQRVLDNWRRMYDGVCAELEEAIARAEAAEAQAAALRDGVLNFDDKERCSGCVQVSETEYDCEGHYVIDRILDDTAEAAAAYEARVRQSELERLRPTMLDIGAVRALVSAGRRWLCEEDVVRVLGFAGTGPVPSEPSIMDGPAWTAPPERGQR